MAHGCMNVIIDSQHCLWHTDPISIVDRIDWLRARAQFERWLEEQASIYNEAVWVPAYFHTKAEQWKERMLISAESFQQGHSAYASQQMHSWEELSRSSEKALSPITSTPLKCFKVATSYLS